MTGRPQPFGLFASTHGPLIVNRLDYHQLPDGNAYGVGHQILTRGEYDRDEVDGMLRDLSGLRSDRGDGVVVLDCGANIGVHTVEAAKYMAGWGNVVAVEAQERLYYALCGNIALGNHFNARAILAAVGTSNREICVPRPNYTKPASFGSLELNRRPSTEYIGQSVSYAPKDLTTVPQIKIDSLGFSRLDFLKLDIEGMELDALEGANETVHQFRPLILVEWIKSDRAALEDYLDRQGYAFVEIGANLRAEPKA